MKKWLLYGIIFCYLPFCTHAQKEWTNWYNGRNSMISFKTGHPEIFYDYINPVPPETDFFNYYYWSFGNAGISYSDPATGEMRFLVANRLAFSKNFESFPNDYFLRSCPDEYSYHIIPFGDNPNKFYVVQFQDAGADLLQQETGLQVRCPNAIGLGYSIVDLTLNNGLGDFAEINNQITAGFTGQITTVKHANGKDVWVIVHGYSSNTYMAFLFTSNGVQPAVYSNIGPVVNGGFYSVQGTLTASHTGDRLAGYSAVTPNVIQLFNFDNATGIISNYRTLPAKESVSKIQFSPDDSKLYYLNWESLYQYDLNEADVGASLTKVYSEPNGIMFTMQLAPDGKIYISKNTKLVDGEYQEFTGAVMCPNLPKFACNVNPTYLPIVMSGFPDLVNDFIKDPKAAAIATLDLGKDTAICFGSFTIKAPDGWESYQWNTGDTTQSITVKKAGVYSVLTGSTGFSCPDGYGYINVEDKAKKLYLGKDTFLCPKTTYLLTIPDGYTNIAWQNGSSAKDSLIYKDSYCIISANDSNGCFTSDTIGVYYQYYPSADFGADTTLCNNATLALHLLPQKNSFWNPEYTWSDGSSDDSLVIQSQGTYWGSVSFNGCIVKDTITINYVSGETVSLGADTTICEGDSIVLKPNIANATYLWSTGANTQQIIVKNTGSYWVKVTNGACTLYDTIHVTVAAHVPVWLGADTALCTGEQLLLQPNVSGGSFIWQDGSTASSFKVQQTGNYWVHYKYAGCINMDTIMVQYLPLPIINLGNDTGICTGEHVLLNAGIINGSGYLWQDNSIQPVFTASTTGNYIVRVTDNNGCIGRDSITITVSPLPVIELGPDTTLCQNTVLSFNFNQAGTSYLWNDGNTLGNYTISSPGNYAVIATANGCATKDSIVVTYKPLPIVTLGNDTTLCITDMLTLNAFNTGATYLWQDNSSQSQYTVKQAGSYHVSVNLNGCIATDDININYITKPFFTLGNDTLLCLGQEMVLHPSLAGDITYIWQDGSVLPQLTIKDTGYYYVTATNKCGSTTDDILIKTGACILQMPTAFTPNGDGLNDIFRVKYPEFIKTFHLVVFNRWGQQIFETTNPRNGWDGNLKGVKMDMGTYVWIIDLTDYNNNKQTGKGTVTLIR
ncbi:T9SS type B sorting domain-containing protein [Limnovirga soli]|uniref:T9SS type B sorting domain-containing protein n=1 Tax=Limnovirga soli TaxID=2656915 RepID=A0A8J8JRT7_9BACT|nr:gliding motility-associated C-terminal domain-containing protein [Limnovirga soli]NNV56222.1 T9SS type B sorting domain-containing protein [Limnovirga soli]